MGEIWGIIRNGIVRMFYPYGTIRRIFRGPLTGVRFVVEPSMGLTYALGGQGFNWDFLSRHISPGMVIYDVGGNRGQMSLFFSKQVGSTGQVLSFEPVPEMYNFLVKNIHLNSIKNVSSLNIALSDYEGTAVFMFSKDFSTEGKLASPEISPSHGEADSINVIVKRMDSVLEEGMPVPDIIKIDVEGAAAAVLRGAKNIIEQYYPSIYIELHGPEEQQSIKDCLMTNGYHIETLDGEHVADPTSGWHSPLWCYKKSGQNS